MRQLIRPARWLATRSETLLRHPKDHLRLLSSSVDISYEHGVPSSRASRFNPSTLGQLLEKATLKTPDKPIFIVHHQELIKTYRQFNEDVSWAPFLTSNVYFQLVIFRLTNSQKDYGKLGVAVVTLWVFGRSTPTNGFLCSFPLLNLAAFW